MISKHLANERTKIALIISLLLLLVLSVFIPGPQRVTLFSGDVAFFFDTVNRIQEGYQMYVDYNHSYGPFSFLLLLAGFQVHGFSMEAFTIARALATLILCSLAIIVTWKRFHPLFTIVIVFLSWALINTPTPLGYDINEQFTIAFWYNNLGFVISGILLLQIGSRKFKSRFSYEAIVEGILLALLFTNKFQFMIFMALPYAVITFRDLRKREAIKYFIIAFIAFLIVTVLQFPLANTSVLEYIGQIHRTVSGTDYASISSSEGEAFPLLRLFFFRYFIINNYYVLYALAAIALMHIVTETKLFSFQTLFVGSAFISLLFIKLSCNFHKFVLEVPFLELMALLYIANRAFDFKKSLVHAFLVAMIVFPSMFYIKDMLMSNRYMAREEIRLDFQFPPLEDFNQAESHSIEGRNCPPLLDQIEELGYSRFVCDGLSLLENIEDQYKTLFVCHTNDPITMHTDFKYAKGTFTWYTLREANIREHCCDEKYIVQSDLIMLARYKPYAEEMAEFIRSFDPDIYWRSYENENWILLERIPQRERTKATTEENNETKNEHSL